MSNNHLNNESYSFIGNLLHNLIYVKKFIFMEILPINNEYNFYSFTTPFKGRSNYIKIKILKNFDLNIQKSFEIETLIDNKIENLELNSTSLIEYINNLKVNK